jgi:hypothetical protein
VLLACLVGLHRVQQLTACAGHVRGMSFFDSGEMVKHCQCFTAVTGMRSMMTHSGYKLLAEQSWLFRMHCRCHVWKPRRCFVDCFHLPHLSHVLQGAHGFRLVRLTGAIMGCNCSSRGSTCVFSSNSQLVTSTSMDASSSALSCFSGLFSRCASRTCVGTQTDDDDVYAATLGRLITTRSIGTHCGFENLDERAWQFLPPLGRAPLALSAD